MFTPIPKFNDHVNCKGHANHMLDCTYETQIERDILLKVLNDYLKNNNETQETSKLS